MTSCTMLSVSDKTNVSDTDLLHLINKLPHIRDRYVVIQRDVYPPRTSIFAKSKKYTTYDVYYRYDMRSQYEVQQISCPGGFTYQSVYMYFKGLIAGINDVQSGKLVV